MSHTTAPQEAPQRGLSLPTTEEIAQLPPDGGERYNRLIFEHSPYLLQHATNPVDWRPWGEAAFQAARDQNKPIFLSIGYATCHWCHVMEHESFEDPAIGALINEHFIPIKVDREERPDIDHIYMQVTQAMTGHGGWPMTVVMTPDREPFFAGTYFPPRMTFGRTGLTELIPRLSQAWREQREDIARSAQEITRFLERTAAPASGEMLTLETIGQTRRELAQRYDSTHGGFGMAPKFPTPHNLMFLLREWQRTGDQETLAMVTDTLRQMRMGGVYDQVGFGYHRYSTDREWLLPHFEKMLYDNALMVIANTEAFLATGDEDFARTAREIVTYVLRDMTSPEGGFYSAEDADSEGEEGKFYVWSSEEIGELLGQEADLFMQVYQIQEEGNFHDEATGRASGENIPHLGEPLAITAEQLRIPEQEVRDRLDRSRQVLFDAREQRIHPLLDDKILTDWNGLMIAALAISGRGLGEPDHTRAAVRAADFALDQLRDENGRLLKRSRLGQAGLLGLLDDHAFLVWGLIELYETTHDPRFLESALEINRIMLDHFWDDANGGLFLTPDDGEQLLVRPKEIYDGAAPSGNSVAALNLLRLARLTGDSALEERSEQIVRAFAPQAERAPGAHTFLMMALQFALGDSREVVIAGEPDAEDTQAMIRALHSRFLPQVVTVLRSGGNTAIEELAPFTVNQSSRDGRATAYVCRDHACDAPATSIETMLQSLPR